MTASPTPPDHRNSRKLTLLASAAWLLVFLPLFFRQTLPNNPSVTRFAVAESLLDAVLGTEPVAAPLTIPSGWRFLSQRLFPAGCGLIILLAAWLIGAAVVRPFRLSPAWTATERLVVQYAVGVSAFSLLVLLAGAAAQLNTVVLFVPAAAAAVFLLLTHGSPSDPRPARAIVARPGAVSWPTRFLEWAMWLTIAGTTAWLLLGSLSPPTDFDVREYHLQGPKEWFQAGRISFLTHNVYTSFPFLTEMLSLAGMVVTGDWWQGALAGKFVLASFVPATSLAVYCLVRRLSGHRPGLLAALIHLTTPWSVRIAIIAYAEGALSFYLTATVVCLLVRWRQPQAERSLKSIGLTGFLAGSAMACKYTGLVAAVIPAGVVLLLMIPRDGRSSAAAVGRSHQRFWPTIAAFGLGTLIAVGPWLVRNTMDTGNPVYPLAWSLFGGNDWDADINQRWRIAHSPAEHELSQLPRHFLDVAVRNDWTSPLLFGLAVPALLLWRRIPGLPLVACLAGWQLLTWWGLTHRIDRFWVPVIPLLAVPAACAGRISDSPGWRSLVIGVVAIGTLFNLRFVTLPLVGYHAGLQDLNAARQLVIRSDIRYLNESLPATARVLMVGEAEVFDCTFPVLYNTVFDESLFERMTVDPSDSESSPRQRRMLSAADVTAHLKAAGITHVLVNWAEILRYRSPGSYGYAPYVQPSRFRSLVESGVLLPPRALLSRSVAGLSQPERSVIDAWDDASFLQPSQDSLSIVQLFALPPTPHQ